jgi:hypothetical protein
MSDAADVRSIDAVRDWHAALAEYGDMLAEALAGVEMEIRRAHDWLGDQLSLWQRSIRQCEDEVTRAKAELAQRKLPTFDGREPDCSVQEKALRLAKAKLEHAEEQVEKCRRWLSRLPKMVDEVYVGPSRRLGNFIEADLPKALADLSRRIVALESYAQLRTDYSPAPAASSVVAAPPARKAPAKADGAENAEQTAAPPGQAVPRTTQATPAPEQG